MTKFVEHFSLKGDKWEVVDDLGDEWEVKSKTDERDTHYLPKSEFIECLVTSRKLLPSLLILFALIVSGCGPSASEIRQQQYWSWYQTLTPEQQEREDQRQHERSLAAMQALSQMQMVNGPTFSLPPSRPYQAPQYNDWVAPSRQRTNCTTNLYGNQANTTCY